MLKQAQETLENKDLEIRPKVEFHSGFFLKWQVNIFEKTLVEKLVNKTSFLPSLVEVLLSRGKTDYQKIYDFVFCKQPDPGLAQTMKDAQKTVARILLALERKEKILVFGDYDVDGMTSVSIFILAMVPLGAKVQYFLPNRVVHGYGISANAVKAAAESGFTLIITVDNGTCAQEAAQAAQELGIDLIVTDHHQPKEDLPNVFALVNPHQKGCNYPFKEFCGAGVIFKIVSIIYQQLGRELPEKVLELMTLGTIADVVALEHENRFWVKKGLAQLCKSMSYSFQALAKNAGIDTNKGFWSALDIGFSIAPQLNALGRMADPTRAVRFLISDNAQDVELIAQELKEVNNWRKEVDREIYAHVCKKIKTGEININTSHVIFDSAPTWPAGVVGLVAGKLMQTFARPTFLFHITKDGIAKGSCRSIPEVDVLQALNQAKDLLITYGGHTCAAGLSLDANDLPKLEKIINQFVASKVAIETMVPKIVVDATLGLSDLSKVLFDQMQLLEPFGQKNPFPTFLIKHVGLSQAPVLVGEKHVRLNLFKNSSCQHIIFFNRPELITLLGNYEKLEQQSFNVLAKVDFQHFNSKLQIKLIGLDIAIVQDNSKTINY